jgi:Domain of unknown function (DUF4145)
VRLLRKGRCLRHRLGRQHPALRSAAARDSVPSRLPNCNNPTFVDGLKQVPDVAPGVEVSNLPLEVDNLYREARNCVAASAYTASVLCCRKLLMHIAVAQGDQPGKTFFDYVDYLATKGFVPPNGRGWVDHIRRKGNEANHEIKTMTKAEAQELITFLEMLLKFIYEFPSRVPASTP